MKVVTIDMRRVLGDRFATIATVAVFLLSALSVIGASAAFGPSSQARVGHVGAVAGSSGAAPLTTAAVPRALPHPSVGPGSVSVAMTSTVAGYQTVPFNLSFSLTLTNATVCKSYCYPANPNSTVQNTFISVEVRDVATICQGILGLFVNCPTVANISLNSSVANGTTSYTAYIDDNALLTPQFRNVVCPNIFGYGAPCSYNGGVLPNDQYQIFIWVSVNNTVNNASAAVETTSYLVTTPLGGQWLSPSPLGAVSTGNVSVAIQYQGSYVSTVSATIYQGTSASGPVVYTQSVFAPGVGQHTVVAAAVWSVPTPGSYYGLLNVSGPSGYKLITATFTVLPAGITVYQNSSHYENATLIPGFSPAVGGTVLLVVGLIVGMVVALLLGRMMWAGAKPSASPQPWQAAKANECSVCHQSFASEAELKEHAKSAHGITQQ